MNKLRRPKEFLHQPIAELGPEPLVPLPSEEERNPDGKSLVNPPRADGLLSAAYDAFPDPIDSSNNGFDFHVYYMPSNKEETQYARDLHERIRREFPEVRSSVNVLFLFCLIVGVAISTITERYNFEVSLHQLNQIPLIADVIFDMDAVVVLNTVIAPEIYLQVQGDHYSICSPTLSQTSIAAF